MKADTLGYFWLPCPLCGQYFGGHEWQKGPDGSIIVSYSRGKGVCPDCATNGKAKAYNDKIRESDWYKAEEAKANENIRKMISGRTLDGA